MRIFIRLASRYLAAASLCRDNRSWVSSGVSLSKRRCLALIKKMPAHLCFNVPTHCTYLAALSRAFALSSSLFLRLRFNDYDAFWGSDVEPGNLRFVILPPWLFLPNLLTLSVFTRFTRASAVRLSVMLCDLCHD